jgi:hypothetical protein
MRDSKYCIHVYMMNVRQISWLQAPFYGNLINILKAIIYFKYSWNVSEPDAMIVSIYGNNMNILWTKDYLLVLEDIFTFLKWCCV